MYTGVQSEIDDCLFSNCSARSWGGGIYAEFWGIQNISRCVFLECKSLEVFIFLFIFLFIYLFFYFHLFIFCIIFYYYYYYYYYCFILFFIFCLKYYFLKVRWNGAGIGGG
jgi:hypothetical protein